jgi:DMSO reductase family type II enzyme chaperone
LAAARSAVYRLVLATLDKPTPEQHAWLTGPAFRHSLEMVCTAFGLPWPEGALFPDSAADHESRYLACFEVGLPEPPVALLASHYNRREPVPRIIHEHILFYKRFGMHPLAGPGEPADHLSHELAFLIHLDELLTHTKLDVESVLRARSDFLTRHVARWPARAAAAAEEKHLPPVYCLLLDLLAAAVQQDLQLTADTLGRLGLPFPDVSNGLQPEETDERPASIRPE